MKPQKSLDITDHMTRMLMNALEEEGLTINWLAKRHSKTKLDLNAFEQIQYNAVQSLEERLQSIGQEIEHVETTDQFKGFYIKAWLSKKYVIGTFVEYEDTDRTSFINSDKWQLNEIQHDGPEDKWPHYDQHHKATIYQVGSTTNMNGVIKMFKECIEN